MFASFVEAQNLIAQNPILFFVLLAWSLYWKGVALWKSAREGHQRWFIVMLILNTLGILEILYLYIFAKRIKKSETPVGA